MVIHWNMTYNRHCRGIHSALPMVSLLWWLLQPVATPRGCWGPASDQPSLGFSSPCCLSRGQQLSQLSLTQKYFQASKLPLAIRCHTFVSSAATTFRGELDWGEPENKMSASLASEQMAHGGAVPDTSIFFYPQKCWGCSVTLQVRKRKTGLATTATDPLSPQGGLWHQECHPSGRKSCLYPVANTR